MHSDLLLNSLRQFCENEFVAHVAEVEHEVVGKIGIEVDGDPCATVRVITRQDRIGVFGAQFENAVGVALEGERVAPGVRLFSIRFDGELAGELPATDPVDHPAPLLVERFGGAGIREQACVYGGENHGYSCLQRSSVGSTAPRRDAASSTVQPIASAMRGAQSSIMSSIVVS